jgi:hypothetical protein
MLPKNKHPSLFGKDISYKKKSFIVLTAERKIKPEGDLLFFSFPIFAYDKRKKVL